MGSENVSTALSWCAILLSENLPAQREARKSKESLMNAFHEAMRLYPSVAALTRTCSEDTEICGYEIPRFTEVQLNMYSIHRNENTWGEDASEYRPNRCPVISTLGPPDAFPFGGGKRSCIGRPLTNHEVSFVLSQIFENFELHAVVKEGEELRLNLEARTTPNNFVSLRPGNHQIAFVPLLGISTSKL
jgi:cytochrome P450/NADPH-cytochrome P450 reductase